MTRRIKAEEQEPIYRSWTSDARGELGKQRENYSRLGQVRLSLDALEDKFGCTSAVAMLRMKSGRMGVHSGWQALYAEYRRGLEQSNPTPPPAAPGPPVLPDEPRIPVDSADAREHEEALD